MRHEVKLKPFNVPNYVIADGPAWSGLHEGIGPDDAKFPLSDLSPQSLDDLCRRFRDDVFKKAGKNPPPQIVPLTR
jgi:hypothetical protein